MCRDMEYFGAVLTRVFGRLNSPVLTLHRGDLDLDTQNVNKNYDTYVVFIFFPFWRTCFTLLTPHQIATSCYDVQTCRNPSALTRVNGLRRGLGGGFRKCRCFCVHV